MEEYVKIEDDGNVKKEEDHSMEGNFCIKAKVQCSSMEKLNLPFLKRCTALYIRLRST
jgi:hypothetical protein